MAETKSIICPANKAQELADTLNNPRNFDEEGFPDNGENQRGFGPNTVDIDSAKDLSNNPNKVTHLGFTLPTSTFDFEGGEERLHNIVKAVGGAQIKDYHPSKEDVEFDDPQGYRKAKGLERMNNDNANV